jgi:hypothetical protein
MPLGAGFVRLAGHGFVEVLEPWTDPETGRLAAITEDLLQALCRSCLPVAVEGDPVQQAINRTSTGWVWELINNRGMVKRADQAAIVDPDWSIRVVVRSKVASPGRWLGDQDGCTRHPIDWNCSWGPARSNSLSLWRRIPER